MCLKDHKGVNFHSVHGMRNLLWLEKMNLGFLFILVILRTETGFQSILQEKYQILTSL